MKTLSTTILRQLTAALFDRELFQVGYLLMALAEAPEDAAALKNKIVSWLALERLANVPHDLQYDDSSMVCCIDNSGAIVSFVSMQLEGSTAPLQYIEQVRIAGRYIARHYTSGQSKASSMKKQEVIKSYKEICQASNRIYEGLLEECPVNIIILPGVRGRCDACLWLPKLDRGTYWAAIPELSLCKKQGLETLSSVAAAVLTDKVFCSPNVTMDALEADDGLHICAPRLEVIGTQRIDKSRIEALKARAGSAKQALQVTIGAPN